MPLLLKARVVIGLLGALAVSKAHATITTIATPSTTAPANGLMSTFSGVTTLTFNNSTTLPSGFSGGAVLNGNVSQQYAAPSGDTSNFFAVGMAPNYTGSASFTPGGMFNYFGLYWGSIDAFNTIAFTLNGVDVGTFSGSMFAPATGSQTAANTNEFLDFVFSPGTGYDKVTFTTTSPNLEVDNIAYGRVAVPEPASLALLGTGIVGVAGLVRRRKSASRPSVAA